MTALSPVQTGSAAAGLYIHCEACRWTTTYEIAVQAGWRQAVEPFTYHCAPCALNFDRQPFLSRESLAPSP